MSDTPTLTDRPALARYRDRARRGPALFLHEEALADVQDRLALVNKSFSAPAVVTPFPDLWRNAFPTACLVDDTEVLALSETTHDLVIHAMALHWANDPVGQLIQCRRALVKDGLFLGVLPGGNTLTELRTVLAEAEAQITGGLSPRVAPMAEIRDLGALLQRAGLALPVADLVPITAEYRDLTHLMHDLRAMGETNSLAGRLRHPTRRGLFEMANRLYQQHFATDQGRLRATFELVCLTGWVPDVSQPQPLRPGSAASRLADALGTRETRLHD